MMIIESSVSVLSLRRFLTASVLLVTSQTLLFLTAFPLSDREMTSSWTKSEHALQNGDGMIRQGYTEKVAVVANKTITYRFSRLSFDRFEAQQDEQIITGVLSRPGNKQQRDMVRRLWAQHHTNVFFVVGNNWTDIEEEFRTHGDLIWMDWSDTYGRLVWKTRTMIAAFEGNLENYRHIFKTDDDTYVRLGRLEELSAGKYRNVDYWGECKTNSTVVRKSDHRWYVDKKVYAPRFYPRYAMGGGYFLSKKFAHCAVARGAKLDTIPIEDAHTGILAEACGRVCVHEEAIGRAREKRDVYEQQNQTDYGVKYNTIPMSIIGYHYTTCSDERYRHREISCKDQIIDHGNEKRVAIPVIPREKND